MDAQKEKILHRIRALFAKTTAAGATEAEALEAAAKATELMDKHGISFAEVREVNDGGFSWRNVTPKQRWLAEFYSWIGFAVAQYTGTTSTTTRGERAKFSAVGFAGVESDVLFAEWLIQAIGEFVHAGYRQKQAAVRKALKERGLRLLTKKEATKFRNSYMLGAAQSIINRLEKLTEERVVNQKLANALTVISKSKMAEIKLHEQVGHLEPTDHGDIDYDARAVIAGVERGKAVQFHKPISHSDAVAMIGKN